MSSDTDQILAACPALRAAWALVFPNTPLSENAEVTLLAIARAENRFGNSPGFEGSNNWGSLRCYRHDYGCIQAGDRDAGGNPVSASFQKFPSATEGARGFLTTLLKHKNPVPIDSGDPHAVAAAMYSNGYFTGVAGDADARIASYANMIAGSSKVVAAALAGGTCGPLDDGSDSTPPIAMAGLMLIAGALAYGAWKVLT